MTELDFSPSPLNSRFQTYPVPMASPGKCSVCGSVDRPVVDFGLTVEFYGAVVICVLCLTEAARNIQMVPLSELKAAEKSLTQSFEQQLRERNLVVISYEQYNAITMALGGILDTLFSTNTSSDAMVAEKTERTDYPVLEYTEPDIFGFNGVIEQEHDTAVGERPASVSSSDSDGESFNFSL